MIFLNIWSDLRLAFIIILFVIIVKWVIEKTNSKVLGITVGVIIAYLTFYSHYILLIIAIVFTFILPSLISMIEASQGK